MEDNEVHPLVELMLKRMESHPEEFEGNLASEYSEDVYRWNTALNEIIEYGSEADKTALHAGLREVRLEAAHRWALDELLNGLNRRKEEEQKQPAANTSIIQAQMAKAQAHIAQSQAQAQMQNALGAYGQYANTLASVTNNSTLQLGDEKIDATLIKKIKGALGI